MRNTKYPGRWKGVKINRPNEKKRSTSEKVHAGNNVFLNLANKNVDFFQELLLWATYQKPSVVTEDNGVCLCGRKKRGGGEIGLGKNRKLIS